MHPLPPSGWQACLRLLELHAKMSCLRSEHHADRASMECILAVMWAGAEKIDGAPAVSPEYLFHSARTEAEGSSGPDCCPKMLLKKLLDMLPLAVSSILRVFCA